MYMQEGTRSHDIFVDGIRKHAILEFCSIYLWFNLFKSEEQLVTMHSFFLLYNAYYPTLTSDIDITLFSKFLGYEQVYKCYVNSLACDTRHYHITYLKLVM